jgi:hypothetical protein
LRGFGGGGDPGAADAASCESAIAGGWKENGESYDAPAVGDAERSESYPPEWGDGCGAAMSRP